jgi:RNA polymerase sigma-70 factor (ECF subfamily)
MRAFPPTLLHMSDASRSAPLAPDEIIERCLNGDQAAWEAIVRLYWRKVFNVAYKFVGRHDMAEDLTQDVFLKLYKSLDTFDRRANFQTWLISVSRNLCIDHYRSVRKERETINRDVDASELMPISTDLPADTRIERHDRVVLLRQALDKLAPTLRTAVMLRDIQELTYQEIADQLHLPEGTVKSRINRGRTELARQIQKLREQQDAIPRTGVSG